jgi:tRNA 2-thiouridine synthesizing protein D
MVLPGRTDKECCSAKVVLRNQSNLLESEMRFAFQITSRPHSSGSDSAYQFIRATLAAGHEIVRIFFYGDGAYHGLGFATDPGDEHQVVGRWSSLARDSGVDLVVCISAAQRRGVIGTSVESGDAQSSGLGEGFRIGGTGLWIEACLSADRFIVFKG